MKLRLNSRQDNRKATDGTLSSLRCLSLTSFAQIPFPDEPMIHRRDLLKSAFVLSTACHFLPARLMAANAAANDSTSTEFSYAILKGHARALAGRVYQPPRKLAPQSLQRLDYDQYQSIRFRSDHALWADENLGFRVQFFHMGRGFKEPVRMYEVANGQASELTYHPDAFDFGESGVNGKALPVDLAFAGFRIQAEIGRAHV